MNATRKIVADYLRMTRAAIQPGCRKFYDLADIVSCTYKMARDDYQNAPFHSDEHLAVLHLKKMYELAKG